MYTKKETKVVLSTTPKELRDLADRMDNYIKNLQTKTSLFVEVIEGDPDIHVKWEREIQGITATIPMQEKDTFLSAQADVNRMKREKLIATIWTQSGKLLTDSQRKNNSKKHYAKFHGVPWSPMIVKCFRQLYQSYKERPNYNMSNFSFDMSAKLDRSLGSVTSRLHHLGIGTD